MSSGERGDRPGPLWPLAVAWERILGHHELKEPHSSLRARTQALESDKPGSECWLELSPGKWAYGWGWGGTVKMKKDVCWDLLSSRCFINGNY